MKYDDVEECYEEILKLDKLLKEERFNAKVINKKLKEKRKAKNANKNIDEIINEKIGRAHV